MRNNVLVPLNPAPCYWGDTIEYPSALIWASNDFPQLAESWQALCSPKKEPFIIKRREEKMSRDREEERGSLTDTLSRTTGEIFCSKTGSG